jgi:hypothetical protein
VQDYDVYIHSNSVMANNPESNLMYQMGKGNQLLMPLAESNGQKIHCRQRLGGLLKFYTRAA